MNCVKCGKPILFIKNRETERPMPVDEVMAYVVQDDNARLRAITRTGDMFRARLANCGDKDAVKAYLPHFANCKRKQTTLQQSARCEYDRRQGALIDAQIAEQRRRSAARAIVRRERDAEEYEQLALF